MSELNRLSAAQLAEKLAAKEVSAVEVTQAHLDRMEAVEKDIHAFLHVDSEGALETAKQVDARRQAGDELPTLAGVPIALKDLVATKGLPTTAASRILEGWIPPYDATITQRIKAAGMPILGKTNLDEFAMGSSTEFSAFGPTRNPWDLDRIPGGSGGGSAAAVAAYEAPLAIGTDTGGSIRQPGAVTGTVGIKPTYGGVSRYGIIALASSLDQAGPVARTVLDAALLHEVIGGHDPMDSTSLTGPIPSVVEAAHQADVKGMKIGIVKQLNGDGYQAGVRERFEEAIEILQSAGAEITEVSCPSFDYALSAYYLILPAEASSNLAKYDAVRYGLRVSPDRPSPSIEDVMAITRDAGFGPEVKRRIILGTYALSSGYYDAYYGLAQKVRTMIANDFNKAFADVDVLVSPTSPTTAFEFGSKIDDPVSMYLQDIATIPANLAGIPGISVPAGLASEDGLPVGFQALAPAMADDRLYRLGGALEALLEDKWGGPVLAKAPEVAK